MGTVLASREVRWFGESQAGDFAKPTDWIEIPKDEIWKPDRPDVYVVVPRSDDLGIKWREGELQINGRIAVRGMQLLGGRWKGWVEKWIKWSYRAPEIDGALAPWFNGRSEKGPAVIRVQHARGVLPDRKRVSQHSRRR